MIKIDPKDLIDLIYYARRYCDGRATYAPSEFNAIYQRIRSENPDFIRKYDHFDPTLTLEGTFFPYAQDGMYNENNGSYDAINKDYLKHDQDGK